MQRIFFSSGHSPAVFWESTFDEVLLIIKGTVDKWRLERKQAWKIVEGFRGTKDMPAEYDFYPLPYDDEIKDIERQRMAKDLELYNEAVKNFDNIIWEKPVKR